MKRLGDLGRRHLRDRPVRSCLVGISIALGVAVLLGVLAGGATMRAGLDRLAGNLGGRADVLVSPGGPLGSTLPLDAAARLAAADGVERAVPLRATVASSGATGLTTTVVAVDASGLDLLGASVLDGRLPSDEGEVVVDRAQADDLGVDVGGELELGSSLTAKVVGLLERGALTAAAGGEVVLGLPSLADALGAPAAPSRVLVDLDGGVEPSTWIEGHRAVVADARLEDADALRNPLEDLFGGILDALGAVSTIVLLLAGYLIHLALTASVAQRTSTYATLLALGATRRQVLSTVVAEVLWLAVGAVVAGLVAGLVLARFLAAAVAGIFGTPDAGLVVRPAHIVACAVAGLACAAFSSLVPARAAARVAPSAAVSGHSPPAAPSPWPVVTGAVLGAVAVVLVVAGPESLGPVAVGLALIGTVLALPAVLPRVAAVLQPLVRRVSPGVGEVAVAHLVKERSRSALTAGLFVAVLAVTLVAGTGYRTMAPSFREYMQLQFGSDLQLDAGSALAGRTFPADYVDAVRRIPGVSAATPMWHARTEIAGIDGDRVLTVVDPATHFGPAGYLFVAGDVEAARTGLGAGGVLVSHLLAEQEGWAVGSTVELLVGGRTAPFTIAATYASFGDDYSRAFVIGRADGERVLPGGLGAPNEVRVDVADAADAAVVASQLPPIPGPEPVRIGFGTDNVAEAVDQFQSVWSLFLVIQVLAATIGILGIANTMAISVLERSREIGLLRALGTRIVEVRRMVFVEALALVAVALVVAVGLSWLLSRDIGSSASDLFGFTGAPDYPWMLVPVLAVLAGAAAVAASVLPARRAARVDPCDALRLD